MRKLLSAIATEIETRWHLSKGFFGEHRSVLMSTLWWCLLTLVLPMTLVSIGISLSTSLRWSGTTLELAGLARIAFDLNTTMRDLGSKGIRERLEASGQHFLQVLRGKRIVEASVFAGATAMTMTGYAVVVQQESDPGASIDDRVKNLETRMREQEKAQAEFHPILDGRMSEITGQLNALRENMSEQLKVTHDKIQGAMIGDVPVKLGGLVLVACGVLLANIPDEIAWLISRLT